MKHLFGSALVVLALAGCSGVSYRPVQETSFEQVADRGCTRKDEQFSVTAQVNAAYRETIVLWNGRDPDRTLAVSLPGEGVGSKLRGVFGDSRYDLSVERLEQLRARNTPITINLRCERKGATPFADRYSYYEGGQRVEFEF